MSTGSTCTPPSQSELELLHDIDWDTATAVRAIHGGLGSSGVFLVTLGSGGVVLKPASASNLCAELFGTLVMHAVGIPAPNARVAKQSELKPIGRALHKPELYAEPEDKEVLWQRFRKGNCIWLMSAFVEGKNAYALDIDRDLASTDKLDLFRQLGRIATVDAALNNYDRVPVVHTNTGNAENWLVALRTTDADTETEPQTEAQRVTVVPIDQSVSRITAEPGQKMYLAKIKSFVDEIRSRTPGECCNRLRAHFSENLGWTITDEQLVAFLEGGREICAKLVDIDKDKLAQWKSNVEAQFVAGGVQPWLLTDKLAAIDLDFVAMCLAALQE